MRNVTRYRSQLLMRRSYKPIRVKPAAGLKLVFKPSRGFGSKPRFELVP
jgi:hypothetical protein